MKPETESEKMMYNTILIETPEGRGTGFFYDFDIGNGQVIRTIFTNKHVVNEKNVENTKLTFHLEDEQGNIADNITINENIEWNFHSTKDLCYCFAVPLIQLAEKISGKKVFAVPITEEIIYSKEQLKDLSAIEDIVMIGYPIGLSDLENNLPIFRKGITASHPAIDFNESGIGVVDIACFPGSSGSPIFIVNEGSYTDKKGTTFIGKKRIIFLGILYSGAIMSAEGTIEDINIPINIVKKSKTQVMINLGYYIKAHEILSFNKEIRDMIS